MSTTDDKRLAQRVSNLEADAVWRSRQVLLGYCIFAVTVIVAAFILESHYGVSQHRFDEVTQRLCAEIQMLRAHLQLPPADCVPR